MYSDIKLKYQNLKFKRTNTMKSALTEIVEKSILKNQQKFDHFHEVATKSFAFYMQISSEEQPLKVIGEVEGQMTIQEGLNRALQMFQKVLSERNKQLNKNIENFTPRLTKKNGRPKTDMPSLDIKQKFSQIKINSISIQINNKSAIREKKENTSAKVEMKSMSIHTEMELGLNKKQIMDEQEEVKKQKSEKCFFSFC